MNSATSQNPFAGAIESIDALAPKKSPAEPVVVHARHGLRTPSSFQLGDLVVALGCTGTIEAVTFRPGKVCYDVKLDLGGETLCNVDSTFVTR